MKLRLFISFVLLALIGVFSFHSDKTASAREPVRKFTRPLMLESMARECVVPGVKELADAATVLSAATQELLEAPSTNALGEAQRAWVELQHCYKRNQVLGHGPIKDSTFWTSMFYHQALPAALENVIRSQRPIDTDFVEVLGSSARGFYALEYLLFDLPQGPAGLIGKTNGTPRLSGKLLMEGTTAERRRVYVRALAADLERRLREANLEAASAEFPKRFASGGQENVDLVVNQVIDGIESGVILPLNNCALQHQTGSLRYDAILGMASGTSVSSLQAVIEGVERYYSGRAGMGIDDYIQHVNPDLARRIDAAFKNVQAHFRTLGTSLDQTFLMEPAKVEQAIAKARELEILLKVDAVSALGVTITFSANDGD